MNPLVEIFSKLSVIESNKGRYYPSRAFEKVARQLLNSIDIKMDGIVTLNDGTVIKLGASSTAIVNEYLQFGTCTRLSNDSQYLVNDELAEDLSKIHGIGEVKSHRLLEFDTYASLDDFINRLPKVGDYIGHSDIRYTDMMSTGVELYKLTGGKRLDWKLANNLANSIIYSAQNGIDHYTYKLGSLRRLKSTVGDIDLVVSNFDQSNLLELIDTYSDQLDRLLVSGDSKISGIKNGFQVDIRFIDTKYLGAHILHGTGSQKFNILMRSRAKLLGYKLNEYCITDNNGNEIYFDDEKSIFSFLGVKYLEPKYRSDIYKLEYF